MPHFHRTPTGQETTIERTAPGRPELHWHVIDGQRTSIDEFGPGHTHRWQGEDTSGPIEVSDE